MLKQIKTIFMGTPNFSIPVLKMLTENTNLIAVVTQPDKIIGRGNKTSYSKVKQLALENNIQIFQPTNIKKQYQPILDLKPDIIITCAYGQIVPPEILNYPKYGAINVHASLLPKLRGGAPIHHAIIDNYQETGITIMYMDIGMDTGDIISQQKIAITKDDTYQTLHDKLSQIGATLLKQTLPSIINHTNQRIKQDQTKATYAYNIKREEELINFTKTKEQINNQIRGLNETPGAYCLLNQKNLKIYQIETIEDDTYKTSQNGEIVKTDKKAIYVKVKNGLIKILDIKYEGKKRMPTSSFLNGTKENLVGQILNKGVQYEKQ